MRPARRRRRPRGDRLRGGLSGADELLDGVDSALRSRLDFHRAPRIRRASLGPVAGLIGAGLLTRHR
ncbi:hypothetical protein IOD13_15620 [Brevibacterium casei]|nr:hypothetical protein [Brevibacterium casei]